MQIPMFFGPMPKEEKKITLITLSGDTQLKEYCDRINARNADIAERRAFFEKQIQAQEKKNLEFSKEDWRLIEDRLKDLNLLPDNYNPKIHNLGFSTDENRIYYTKD